jgi:UDP-glucose 4-epimerase
MMAWLVTGGAGYIGSHVVRAFQTEGLDVVVLDNLSSGHESFVPNGVPFVRGDVLDGDLLLHTFHKHHVQGVVLAAMTTAAIDRIVFSSSAAVYGTPHTDLVTEATAKSPESPYGESKLIGEWLLRDQAIATGLRHTSLRYFNVVGSGDLTLSDTSPHNLFPLVFAALIEGRTPRINGDDYATPDGTCVRDYIHVADLALSHVAAARRLDAGDGIEPVYNLGSGEGVSVGEIMATVRRVTDIDFTPQIGSRRAGDPDRIVASGALAARDLRWSMRHTLEQMVQSGWDSSRAAAH